MTSTGEGMKKPSQRATRTKTRKYYAHTLAFTQNRK